MVGMRYGKLIVISRFEPRVRTKDASWLCQCDCGNTSIVRGYNLKNGHTKSCGHCRPIARFTKNELIRQMDIHGGKLASVAAFYGIGLSTLRYWAIKYRLVESKANIATNCKNCGRVLQQNVGGTRKHCSEKCRREWDKLNQKKNKRFVKECVWCGKKFKTNSKTQKYCSEKCRGAAWHNLAVERAVKMTEIGVKLCPSCGTMLPLSKFHRDNHSVSGYITYCKDCVSKRWAANKAAGKIKRSPESIRKHLEHDRIRRLTDPTYRAHRREYEFMRRTTDPMFKLKNNVKFQVWKSLRDNNKSKKKGRKWESLVGFTLERLKSRLESQFTEGMSWSNYGEWEIDHIVPVSFFNFKSSSDSDFGVCWALENLQPLWAGQNLEKNAKL